MVAIEMDEPEDACGEACLNRLLMIEWYVYCVNAYLYST